MTDSINEASSDVELIGNIDSKASSPLPASDDSEPIVTRKELWSYYSNMMDATYSNVAQGVGPLGLTMTLFQLLTTQAGYDPVRGPGSSCTASDTSGQCVVRWGSRTKAVASVVLIANGISFAIMTAIFTTIGSAADYGKFGRYLLLAVTVICWGAQFSCMALTTPSRWPAAMVLFIIGFVAYGATLVFYAAAFPRLARNTARTRQLEDTYRKGEISKDELDLEVSLEKNRISNISTALNPLANNYTLVLTNVYWIITGIWWFIFQEPRHGPPLPEGEHYLTIGWKQIWLVLKQYKKLPYTFVYLFAFFLLADGLNTTGTLVFICQNDKFSFSFLQNTYLGLTQALASTASMLGFWYIQRYFKISTKRMFVITNVFTILIPLWGAIGIRTNKIGAYNVIFGLFQAPYYAFSQTMMAELTPPGYDNMFFGLFGLSNRASSMIGPNVIQAIINKTGNNWMGFPFLFAICTAASLIIWFAVDVEKGRQDAERWATDRAKVNLEYTL
ncbi:MFS general substrate transporter [Amanita rubescens]|nr:MFS general substrate transporter [Amanita rubescens]